MALTNVVAEGVNTVEWLAAVTTVAVPVYQRHYRWDVDRCSRLLEDIRAVADADDRQTHFIGSIREDGVRQFADDSFPDGWPRAHPPHLRP